MAQEEGVRITGKLVQSDETDVYATHEDRLGQGGLHVCPNLDAMLAITYDKRINKLGMEAKYPDGNGGFRHYNLTSVNTSDTTTLDDWTEKVIGIPGDTIVIDDFTPSGTSILTQYPNAAGVTNGVWPIVGLSSTFTLTTGDLIGQELENGNGLIYNGSVFSWVGDSNQANLVPYENVQADWSQATNTEDDYIKNKPTLVTTFLGLSDTASSYSGQATKIPVVNAGETGLEFVDAGGGHEIQENGAASPQEDVLNIITNGSQY